MTNTNIRVAAVLVGSLVGACGALAQGVAAPLSPGDMVVAEVSRTATTTWLGKVTGWDKYQQASYRITRDGDQVQTLHGMAGLGLLRLDLGAFMVISYPKAPVPEIVSASTDRGGAAIAQGMKWSSRMTYVGQPVDWCSQELRTTFEGAYEVEAQELLRLSVDGKETALPVFPIVERGTWTRCYVGNRYQRFLWSPDLQTVLGLEFQTYNPKGIVHAASFSMRVKEIQREKK